MTRVTFDSTQNNFFLSTLHFADAYQWIKNEKETFYTHLDKYVSMPKRASEMVESAMFSIKRNLCRAPLTKCKKRADRISHSLITKKKARFEEEKRENFTVIINAIKFMTLHTRSCACFNFLTLINLYVCICLILHCVHVRTRD